MGRTPAPAKRAAGPVKGKKGGATAMDLGGANWAILNIVGPLILTAVLLWLFLRSRKSRETDDGAEEATRRLYDEEDEEHRGEDDYVP